MAAYTAGELKEINYIPESNFGVTPASTQLTFGGRIQSLKPNTNLKNEYTIAGTRSGFYLTRGMYEIGMNLKALAHVTSGGYNWRNLFAVYGFGAVGGLTEHLGSFSMQVKKLVGASNFYNFYNGCKINRMTLDMPGPGQPAIFDTDIIAQWVTPDTDKNITGLQSVAVGADAAEISSGILTWAGAITIGGSPIYPKSVKLTVDNKLERMPGNLTGADSLKYPVCVGLTEGTREIILELELWYEAETYFNAMLANTAVGSIAIPLDTFAITLANAVYETNEWPELKQDLMSQTVRIRCPTLTIA